MMRCLLSSLLVITMTAHAPTASAADPLHVVCFGDSITGNRPGEAYHQHYVKFSDLLELMLEARLGPGQAHVTNAGYAGDSTGQRGDRPGAVNRLQAQVIDPKPEIAVILIGGNDGDRDRAATAANLDAIFERCQAAGIQVLALQYHMLADADNPGEAWVHLDDNNDLIATAAAAHGAELLNMAPPMAAAAEAAGNPASVVNQRDRVHLAPGGELVFARSIYHRLAELGWLDRD